MRKYDERTDRAVASLVSTLDAESARGLVDALEVFCTLAMTSKMSSKEKIQCKMLRSCVLVANAFRAVT